MATLAGGQLFLPVNNNTRKVNRVVRISAYTFLLPKAVVALANLCSGQKAGSSLYIGHVSLSPIVFQGSRKALWDVSSHVEDTKMG